jgi:hypothetical protein
VNLATAPKQMALIQYDQWDREYAARRRSLIREAARQIQADPVRLALVVAEAVNESPDAFGRALQMLAEGDGFAFAALATSAVFSVAEEVT